MVERWSKHEIEIVKQNLEIGVPMHKISSIIGRNKSAVSNLVFKLKLKTKSPRVLPLEERLKFYISIDSSSGCWNWTGSSDSKKYGQIRVAGKLRYATHVSLELVGRPVPSGMCACHHCDNPSCINPDHLFIASQGENVRDCIQKGRFVIPPRSGAQASVAASRKRMALICDGHFEPENVKYNKNGQAFCYQCHLRNSRKYKRIRREKYISQGLTSRGTTRREAA